MDLVEGLSKGISEQIADPKMIGQLADLGALPMPTTTAEFGKFIAAETEKWARVIKFAGIKAE